MKKKILAHEFTESLQYLPRFMRDFHDQKDLFKSIDQLYGNSKGYKELEFDWRNNHIFTIDFFLWFMGQHGYTLQKSRRKDVQFFDIKETIEKMLAKRLVEMSKLLSSGLEPEASVATVDGSSTEAGNKNNT